MGKNYKTEHFASQKTTTNRNEFIVVSLNITKSEAAGLKRPQLHFTTCGVRMWTIIIHRWCRTTHIEPYVKIIIIILVYLIANGLFYKTV